MVKSQEAMECLTIYTITADAGSGAFGHFGFRADAHFRVARLGN